MKKIYIYTASMLLLTFHFNTFASEEACRGYANNQATILSNIKAAKLHDLAQIQLVFQKTSAKCLDTDCLQKAQAKLNLDILNLTKQESNAIEDAYSNLAQLCRDI